MIRAYAFGGPAKGFTCGRKLEGYEARQLGNLDSRGIELDFVVGHVHLH